MLSITAGDLTDIDEIRDETARRIRQPVRLHLHQSGETAFDYKDLSCGATVTTSGRTGSPYGYAQWPIVPSGLATTPTGQRQRGQRRHLC